MECDDEILCPEDLGVDLVTPQQAHDSHYAADTGPIMPTSETAAIGAGAGASGVGGTGAGAGAGVASPLERPGCLPFRDDSPRMGDDAEAMPPSPLLPHHEPVLAGLGDHRRSIGQRAIELRTMLKEELTGRFAIIPDYLDSIQGGKPMSWRRPLIQYIYDVGLEYGFSSVTTFTAVQIFDRFLSKFRVDKKELQLLTLVACFCSAKLNESATPGMVPMTASELVARCGGLVSCADILRAEVVMSSALQWDLNCITAFDFMSHLSCLIKDKHMATCVYQQASKLVAAFTLEPESLHYAPSTVGVAALATAYKLLGIDPTPFMHWISSDHGISVSVPDVLLTQMASKYYAHYGPPPAAPRSHVPPPPSVPAPPLAPVATPTITTTAAAVAAAAATDVGVGAGAGFVDGFAPNPLSPLTVSTPLRSTSPPVCVEGKMCTSSPTSGAPACASVPAPAPAAAPRPRATTSESCDASPPEPSKRLFSSAVHHVVIDTHMP